MRYKLSSTHANAAAKQGSAGNTKQPVVTDKLSIPAKPKALDILEVFQRPQQPDKVPFNCKLYKECFTAGGQLKKEAYKVCCLHALLSMMTRTPK